MTVVMRMSAIGYSVSGHDLLKQLSLHSMRNFVMRKPILDIKLNLISAVLRER